MFTYLPPYDPGGQSPVVTYRKHSIIVVLPQPFCPRINVNGALRLAVAPAKSFERRRKSIFWGPGSLSSEKKTI